MSKIIELKFDNLSVIREMNPRLMSYNVEMTEVTGGTFWKSYTPEQIAGTEAFPPVKSFMDMGGIMQVYPPINLYNEKIRKLAKEFGPVWVRVSGTWATKTYYDFDGHTNGVVPEGYQSICTKEQWIGVLDFCKAINAKLLVSVSNCEGLHKAHEPWHPTQAKLLFDLSREHGMSIEAAEFMNEPNMLAFSGAPVGYTSKDYTRDQDIFFKWVRENYPECKLVGPCTVGMEAAGEILGEDQASAGGGIVSMMGDNCTTDQLMEGTVEPLDIYSYHYYNGISDRLASIMPLMHWSPDSTLSEAYLKVALACCKASIPSRDKYCPGGEMWVTESGDAGGGGDTWASTYMDVFRTLNELGGFSKLTNGIIFHNTLASSDYGFLDHKTFNPRPNYFAVLLWTRLMGNTVYESDIPVVEGAHVYCHSSKDGLGKTYLVINNSKVDTTKVILPKEAEMYLLSSEYIRSQTMLLNGRPLVLGPNDELPSLDSVKVEGEVELPPATCTFFVIR